VAVDEAAADTPGGVIADTSGGAAAGTAARAAAEGAAARLGPAADGRVVGVLSIRPTRHFTGEHDGYIGELVVAPHAERRGVGRSLIDTAEAWARDRGLAHLTLHTGAYNASARAFYAALGFAEEEVRPPARCRLPEPGATRFLRSACSCSPARVNPVSPA
jgi:ribosomal protein S18 acetylase RimI-like enzyme